MTTTATEASDQRNRALDNAIAMLLHRLRGFVQAYPLMEDDKMPEHDVAWVAPVGESPAQVILAAIMEHPELWAHAIPDTCCIVPRFLLDKYLGVDVAEMLAAHGAHAVANHANRARYEAEEREERRRAGRPPA